MKKSALMILLIVSMITIAGCDPEDWDVTSSGWQSWGEGTIAEKQYVKHPKLDSKRVICLDFANGDQVLVGKLYESAKVKTGQKGCLYKWTGGDSSRDYNCWFRWIPEEKPVALTNTDTDGNERIVRELEAKIIVLEEKAKLADTLQADGFQLGKIHSTPVVEAPVKKYDWKPTFRSLPKDHVIVLVRTEDGIVTTAHVNKKKEWKLETNRDKLSGGISLTNVKEWKEIDID
jgi:hypothetical protein